MCCNFCSQFDKCKKKSKSGSGCCSKCIEYEFCPLAMGESNSSGLDSLSNNLDTDIDLFGGDEI